MFGRSLVLSSRLAGRLNGHRFMHKGGESTPPFRFISIGEKVALYMAITVAFLSYPTSVLLRLDSLRPREPQLLNEEVQAKIDELRAAGKHYE